MTSVWLGGEINGWWQLSLRQVNRSLNGEEFFEPLTAATGVVVLDVEQPPAPTRTSLPSLETATIAPDFTLPDLFDAEVTRGLSSYAGQPVILNFWASWCVPCRTEMPALQNVYDQLRDEGLVVLGINQLYVDELQAAQDFVAELQLTFPHVRDETGSMSEQQYQIMGLPTTYFVSPDGKIMHVQIGQMSDMQIDTLSRQLVAGEKLTP
ncbi:MAG: peroxiredoxin family protein [Anaerolineae bacterium]